MRFVVDLDGVCYEWQRTYRYMLREYRGVEMPPIEDFWYRWDAQKDYGTKADHDWMWSEGVKLGLFRYGHMVKGARRGLQELDTRGHEIVVATSRPERAVSDTLDWLSLYMKDIPLAGVHILSNGTSKGDLDGDILVDDYDKNIVDWTTTGRTAWLFSQPWNWESELPSVDSLVRRATGWNGVIWLTEEEEKWRDSTGT